VALVTKADFISILTYTAMFIVLIPIAVFGSDKVSYFWFYDLTARRFEPSEWLAAKATYGSSLKCERLRMVKDLIARYKLIGMTVKEIQELLGPGTVGSWAKGGYYSEYRGDDSINYDLGVTTLWETLDPWWLCMKTKNGRVVEYVLWEQD